MRISDWSSDVCSSDLSQVLDPTHGHPAIGHLAVLERTSGLGQLDGHVVGGAEWVEADIAGAEPGRRAQRDDHEEHQLDAYACGDHHSSRPFWVGAGAFGEGLWLSSSSAGAVVDVLSEGLGLALSEIGRAHV